MNMTENKIVANNGSSIVLYTTDDGSTQLEVKLEKETVWLTQNQMAELFGRDRTVITRHIRNIFKEGELDKISHVQNLHIWVPTKIMKLKELSLPTVAEELRQ